MAEISATTTRVGAAAHNVDGSPGEPILRGHPPPSCWHAVHNVDSSFNHHSSPDYALDRIISKSRSETRDRSKAVKSRVKRERSNHLSTTAREQNPAIAAA